jgi:hypothetical protein
MTMLSKILTKRGIARSFPRNFKQAINTRQEQIFYTPLIPGATHSHGFGIPG